MEGHHSLFLTKFKFFKTATISSNMLCHCEIFLVLAKYNGILNKIMRGPPPHYYFIFSKYFKVSYSKYFEFLSVSFCG